MSRDTRRQFLKTSAAVGGSFLIMGTRASGKAVGANNRMRIGVCGVNGRGGSHIDGWMSQDNVEVAYVIDPDDNVRNRRIGDIVRRNDGAYTPKAIKDVREALDDPNLDAISVATPNHWHSLMTIWGAQAGKHVYVEKPMSHDVREGRIAVEAAKKYKTPRIPKFPDLGKDLGPAIQTMMNGGPRPPLPHLLPPSPCPSPGGHVDTGTVYHLLKKLFEDADVDESGTLDILELGEVLKAYYRLEGVSRSLDVVQKEVDQAICTCDLQNSCIQQQ